MRSSLNPCNERRDRKAVDGNLILLPRKCRRPFIFDCECDLCLLNLSNMPAFYIFILKTLTEVQGLCKADFHQNNIRSSILWNNKNITIERNSIYWKESHTAWIDLLEDLLHENNSFLGYHQFCRKAAWF